jgi:exodeoxyribonuclease VII large subunit
LQLYRENLETILASRVFKTPQLIVQNRQQWVDDLTMKMKVSVRQYFATAKEILRKNLELIVRIEPHRLLGKKTVELNELKNRSATAVATAVHKLTVNLTAQANRLGGLNPKSVLNRGYSITKNKKTGLLIKKPGDVELGDIIITELAEQNLIESKAIKK